MKKIIYTIVFLSVFNFTFAQTSFAGVTFPFTINFTDKETSFLKRLDSLTLQKIVSFANSLSGRNTNAPPTAQVVTDPAQQQLQLQQQQQQAQQKAQQQQQQVSALSQLMSGLLGKGFGQGGNQNPQANNQGNPGNNNNNGGQVPPGGQQNSNPPPASQQESDADKAAREKREKEKAEADKKKYDECVKEIGKSKTKEDCDKLKSEIEKQKTESADEGKSGKLKKLLRCSKIGEYSASNNFFALATSLSSKKDIILIYPKNYASEAAGMDVSGYPLSLIEGQMSGKCYLANSIKKVDTTDKCDGVSANVYTPTKSIPASGLKDCD